ncbi:MAG: hypothetical protein K2H71_01900, partial [Muribaculaceae bacterium]|nr:hypothetical protein [Muribaculaceae bacterium]
VSVYVFKTNDVRKNYILEDEDDIVSLARLADIGLTQNAETDYQSIKRGIDERASVSKSTDGFDFIFPLPGGRVAKKFADFSTSAAKKGMQQYMKATEEYARLEKELKELRMKYHAAAGKNGAAGAMRDQIIELEKKRDQQMAALKQLRNAVVAAETKQ